MFVCATKAEYAAVLVFALGCLRVHCPRTCSRLRAVMPAAALVAEHGAGKMQARKKFHATEQSLFKVRALKCYLNEYKMAKTCSGRVGSSNPEPGPWRVQLEQAGERVASPGIAALCGCRALTGRRPRSAGLPALREPCGCKSRRKPNKTRGQLLNTILWDCITTLAGKFPSTVHVFHCRLNHITNHETSTGCLYCLCCLSLWKHQKRAMCLFCC